MGDDSNTTTITPNSVITQKPPYPMPSIAPVKKRNLDQLKVLQQSSSQDSKPPLKRHVTSKLSKELGECIKQDVKLLREVGWERFVSIKRGPGDLSHLNFHHPARSLLNPFTTHGPYMAHKRHLTT